MVFNVTTFLPNFICFVVVSLGNSIYFFSPMNSQECFAFSFSMSSLDACFVKS